MSRTIAGLGAESTRWIALSSARTSGVIVGALTIWANCWRFTRPLPRAKPWPRRPLYSACVSASSRVVNSWTGGTPF